MVIDTLSIEYFLAVAKYLNFTKAANALYVSQPAISRKVSALEKELGCCLIDRTSKNVVLTPAGKAFQIHFTKMMYELEDMVEKVKGINSEKSGKISIGVFQEWDFSKEFRPVIQRFREEYSNIALNIDTNSEQNLFKGLKHGKYDIILGIKVQIENSVKRGYLPEIQIYDLTNAKKILLFSRYNTIVDGGKANLTPVDFKDQLLYTFADEDGPLGLSSNERLLNKKYGFKPKYKLVTTIDSIFTALSTGEGYTIVDSMVRAKSNNEYQYIELDDYNTVSIASLINNSNNYSSIFMNYCISYFENLKSV